MLLSKGDRFTINSTGIMEICSLSVLLAPYYSVTINTVVLYSMKTLLSFHPL